MWFFLKSSKNHIFGKNFENEFLWKNFNYISLIPWDDVRVLSGVVMYDWYPLNNAYLQVLTKPEITMRYVIYTDLNKHDATEIEYYDFKKFVNEKLPPKSSDLVEIYNLAEID